MNLQVEEYLDYIYGGNEFFRSEETWRDGSDYIDDLEACEQEHSEVASVNLRDVRLEMDLSQKELADRLELHVSTIRRIEKGDKKLTKRVGKIVTQFIIDSMPTK